MSFYDSAVYFYNFFLKKLLKRDLEYKNKPKKDRVREAKDNLKQLIYIHDTMLSRHGQFGIMHRCNRDPLGSYPKKKDLTSNYNESIPVILGNATLYFYKNNPNLHHNRLYNIASGRQCDVLCQGGNLLVNF